MTRDQMFILGYLASVVIFLVVYITVYWWYNAVCPGCGRRAPDFVWSYGHASKTYCEKCDPRRIKDVFGDNLKYLEYKQKKQDTWFKRLDRRLFGEFVK